MEECERAIPLVERIAQDFMAMKPWLPESVDAILDIGCGHGHIDVHLAKHYGGAGLEIHLLDGDKDLPSTSKTRTGYLPKSHPWRDRGTAVRRLQEAFPQCRVYEHPPDPKLTIPCDLIVSRRAWGHHFPIAIYIGLADRSLRPGGRIITDIRLDRGRDVDNLSALRSRGFKMLAENIEVRSMKCHRVVMGR